jgi:hypothetical protein
VRKTVERATMVYNAFWFTTKVRLLYFVEPCKLCAVLRLLLAKMNDTFPAFEESDLRKFVREMCVEEYFTGQHIITQNEVCRASEYC